MNLTPAEARRKLVHTAVGSLALLLRFMSWREAALMAVAAFFFNWLALPRLGGRGLWREAGAGRGYPLGVPLYPPAPPCLASAFPADSPEAARRWGGPRPGGGMAACGGVAARAP